MLNSYLYSYRLTYFGGTAPCYDGDYLSLAICKPLIRGAIGKSFHKDDQDNYWLIGIAGNTLCLKQEFKGWDERILYIARVDDVKSYASYFLNVEGNRRHDQIYVETNHGPFVDKDDKGVERHFAHIREDNPKNILNVHAEAELMKRDWRVSDKSENNSKGKFVLISRHYCFPDEKESKELKALITEDKLAGGRGHRVIRVKQSDKIIETMDRMVLSSVDHGKKNLPEPYQKCTCKGCGREKITKTKVGNL